MLKNLIRRELRRIIEENEIVRDFSVDFTVERPADEQFGDYSSNLAMLLAKILKKRPMEIAKEISVELHQKLNFVEKIQIEAPGFINFYLKKKVFFEELKKIKTEGEKYGSVLKQKNCKILLEHTNVNPNKALHVGHLRSACLGNSCEKILRFLGYPVETEYYVDDTGVQVAISALGIKQLSLEPLPEEKYDHYAGRAYVEAMQTLEEKPLMENEKNKLLETLDKQTGKNLDFLKDFVQKVLQANLWTVEQFAIDYDLLVWESDILQNHFWQETFEILKNNPQFQLIKSGKNKGCWVLKNQENQEKVIVKSNGNLTYTAKDLAYHFWKFSLLKADFKYAKWTKNSQKKSLWTTSQEGKSYSEFGKADRVINFIDGRQSFPQEIIRNCLQEIGQEKKAENFFHIGYGVVSLAPRTAREIGLELSNSKKQYAMSGRKGFVFLADDLLELLDKKIKQKYPEGENSREIAVSAIKYFMLKHNTFSDIVFDHNQVLDLYGNTGPYLQYAFARSNKVVNKSLNQKKLSELSFNNFKHIELSSEETKLLRWIIHFPEIVAEAGKQYAPNLICAFLFELASRFNTFYNKKPILKNKEGEEVTSFRILITIATAQILKNGLALLGIKTLEKM